MKQVASLRCDGSGVPAWQVQIDEARPIRVSHCAHCGYLVEVEIAHDIYRLIEHDVPVEGEE